MVAGVAGLTIITARWQLYATSLVMSVGWASMSGAAFNTIIAPWFEPKRGLAVSVALNGGSCGGVLIVSRLMWLIDHVGFAPGAKLMGRWTFEYHCSLREPGGQSHGGTSTHQDSKSTPTAICAD